MPAVVQGKVVFIAHPVRGDIEKNLERVHQYIRLAIRADCHPCCPWYAMVRAMDDGVEAERRQGLRANFAILARCDELWVCGQKITEGMREEIDKAQMWRIPIVCIKGSRPEDLQEYFKKRGVLGF